MRLTKFFLPTIKEVPNDAVVVSHRLMLRAGMIRQLTAGVYSYLPLGVIVFKKISDIIREEMNAIGGSEFSLPALSPNELWAQTGRLEDYGDLMFRIKNRELVLAPTHEEVFASIAKTTLISYKDLPRIWYQIQTKFRNEERPRAGLLRGRQFTMKDAYSFDATLEGLDESYNKHAQAYRNIFTRCGLNFFTVSAHSGAMGGSASEEFMVEAEAGEDHVAVSEDKSYASNVEVAVSYTQLVDRKDSGLNYEEFHTPQVKSIDELAAFLKITDKSRLAKSRVFVNPSKTKEGKDEYILALVCGDDEVNETKLQTLFGINLRPAHPEELMEIAGAEAGSIGPVNFKNKSVKILADLRLQEADELVSGANKNDYHIKNIDLKKDVQGIEYKDIRTVKQGEETTDRKSRLKVVKAIEVGHIFKLGTMYTEALGATFLDAEGNSNPIIMGSYGIGVERIAASHIEGSYDDNGIIWRGEIAPFKVALISVNPNIDAVVNACEDIYKTLLEKNIDVIYDDRADIRAGFKFADADLIGIPLQVIVGKKNLEEGNIELKIRHNGERHIVKKEDCLEKIMNLIKEL